MDRARVLLISQRYQLTREYRPIHAALEREFDLVRYFVDDGWPTRLGAIPGHRGCAAVIWYVRFRELVQRPAFDWEGFGGRRILYDQDAYQSFSVLAGDRFLGEWPRVYRRQRLDTIICTGRRTRDELAADGVHAVWIPKAFDPALFHDRGSPRDGVCYFGELYDARAAMLRHLRRNRVRVARFRCAYAELNERLNRYRGALICNMVAHDAGPRPAWRRLLGRRGDVRLETAPEMMLKNFEVAASGCVAFCDEIPEMRELGFSDGETMVSYRTFDELTDKLAHYRARPEQLDAISSRASALARDRHTWQHRARMFAEVVAGSRVA